MKILMPYGRNLRLGRSGMTNDINTKSNTKSTGDLSVYRGRTVLITGHTGFKGSWLALWLAKLGAKVVGISLDEGNSDGIFQRAALQKKVTHMIGDIRNGEFIKNMVALHQPEIVFHLAAQPLVRESYEQPAATFHTNVLGTVHVLEAIRNSPNVKAAIMITSDKCYKNKGWVWGYREQDELGGHDPYSASKACAEMVIDSYINSFFQQANHQAIASVRAGNVIGGGDWAKDRIVPDCMRALLDGKTISLRNPRATRPWQHVLEPLSGYLLLGSQLWHNRDRIGSWNFGPDLHSIVPVQELVEKIIHSWGTGSWEQVDDTNTKHEAHLLSLDYSKAKFMLQWTPRLTMDQTITMTVDWYKNFHTQDVYALCAKQIDFYSQLQGGNYNDKRS